MVSYASKRDRLIVPVKSSQTAKYDRLKCLNIIKILAIGTRETGHRNSSAKVNTNFD